MREGVRLGIDVGDVRIGVARCDPAGMLAVPVETVPAGRTGSHDADPITRIAALAAECDAIEVVVGWPRTLAGTEGAAARKARSFAIDLARRIDPVAVRLVDERMSTVSALAGYRAQGLSTRQTRSRVDQAAAAVILQSALDTERGAGTAPGELVPAGEPEGGEA